jgi:hypothetical protein
MFGERIELCHHTGDRDLNLSKLELTALPSELIDKYPKLISLSARQVSTKIFMWLW